VGQRALVYGIGNPILTDDAIGPKICDHLKINRPIPGVEYRTGAVGGLCALEQILGYERVVFIDAIRTKDGIPGDVYEFGLSNFKETLHLSSFHDLSFLSAIEMGKNMAFKVPGDIRIIAIEIVEDLVFSNSFSPEIEKKYPLILKEVTEWFDRCFVATP